MLMEKIWKGCHTTAIDANGAEENISIAWNPVVIELIDSSACSHATSTSFHILGSNIHGHLLNVYCPQPPEIKLQLLQFMSWFSQQHHESQLIIGGEFNMITSLTEKKGLNIISTEYRLFKEDINDCRLVDLQPFACCFTWNNYRGGIHHISKILD